MKREPQVARRAARMEVVGSAQDGVLRVMHVAAEAIATPRRGHELHRPLRAGGARIPELAELRLDEVDGGQDLPRHLEAALRLAVGREQG